MRVVAASLCVGEKGGDMLEGEEKREETRRGKRGVRREGNEDSLQSNDDSNTISSTETTSDLLETTWEGGGEEVAFEIGGGAVGEDFVDDGEERRVEQTIGFVEDDVGSAVDGRRFARKRGQKSELGLEEGI